MLFNKNKKYTEILETIFVYENYFTKNNYLKL